MTKATDIYNQAINVLETNIGAESEQLVLPLFALGNLLIKEGKTTDAENAFLRFILLHLAGTVYICPNNLLHLCYNPCVEF